MSFNIAMYTRLSIEKKENKKYESESITNQKYMIENFIKNNSELKDSKVISYSDDGFIGTNFERPEIKRLIEDAKKGKINCIIVKDLSRFGRDYIEVNNYLDKVFPFLNIRFISINDNYDSKNNKNSTTELDIAFKNILYSYYSKDLSLKIKTGKRIKTKQGDYIASYTPFGYKKNKETKRLEVDEETAPIVKMIFELLVEGNTTTQVCKILNSKNIPTKSDFKIKNGIRKIYERKMQNKIWKRQDIYSIIKNEVYIGNTVSFKRKRLKCGSSKIVKSDENEVIKVENTHEPIISKELFYKVKPKDKLNKQLKPSKIFAFKLKCGNCGYSLGCTDVIKNKNIIDKKYYCKTKNEIHNSKCEKILIRESKLKEIVFESLKKELLLQLEENVKKESVKFLKDKIFILKKELDELILERKNLYEDYLYEKLTQAEYLKIKKDRENLIIKLKEQIKSLELDLVEFKGYEEETEVFEKYVNATELTQKMVDIFLKKIYIYNVNTVKIEWNFKNIK